MYYYRSISKIEKYCVAENSHRKNKGTVDALVSAFFILLNKDKFKEILVGNFLINDK